MDVKIKLISSMFQNDEYGVGRKTEEVREVFADVKTVTQTEWFNGGRNGLNPAYKMVLYAFEYNDEQTIEYSGKRYNVYRTFQPNPDKIELYCQKEAGVHNEG